MKARSMLVANSGKHHPEFDLDQARRVFDPLVDPATLDGEMITSPFDLYSVETLRDRHTLRIGEPAATDVFVFGKGEPPRPDCTKIGGRPYWPAGRGWPKAADGRPYGFLGQVNFADSRDLVPRVPADVLSLLVVDSDGWDVNPSMRFEWLASGLRSEPPQGVSAVGGSFFGAIYRAADYPEAEPETDRLEAERKAGRLDHVQQAWTLSVLCATKIGGLPHFMQGGQSRPEGRFLCQIGPVQAEPDLPFPWANHAGPYGSNVKRSDTDRASIHDEENEFMFGDMGSMYLFLGARDEVGFIVEW